MRPHSPVPTSTPVSTPGPSTEVKADVESTIPSSSTATPAPAPASEAEKPKQTPSPMPRQSGMVQVIAAVDDLGIDCPNLPEDPTSDPTLLRVIEGGMTVLVPSTPFRHSPMAFEDTKPSSTMSSPLEPSPERQSSGANLSSTPSVNVPAPVVAPTPSEKTTEKLSWMDSVESIESTPPVVPSIIGLVFGFLQSMVTGLYMRLLGSSMTESKPVSSSLPASLSISSIFQHLSVVRDMLAVLYMPIAFAWNCLCTVGRFYMWMFSLPRVVLTAARQSISAIYSAVIRIIIRVLRVVPAGGYALQILNKYIDTKDC